MQQVSLPVPHHVLHLILVPVRLQRPMHVDYESDTCRSVPQNILFQPAPVENGRYLMLPHA